MTFGQAVVAAVAAWLLVRLAEVVIDGVRALAGRRTAADEQRDDELVEQASRIVREIVQVSTDEHLRMVTEQIDEAKAIRAACEQIAAAVAARAGAVT